MPLTPATAAAIFGAALVGGVVNVLGGGGSFITFPTLLACGVPPIMANATSTVGLWPASLAGAWAMRSAIAGQGDRLLRLGATSVVGGLLGAWLLLQLPSLTFVHLLPYLMGLATLLFAFGKRLTDRLRGAAAPAVTLGPLPIALQFVIAVYGGFYGGGVGILMMAGLAVTGMEDIIAMNALKNLLTAIVNGVAVALFVAAGAVDWAAAAAMVTGAIAGGYAAGRLARHIDPRFVRGGVIALGVFLTGFFFFEA